MRDKVNIKDNKPYNLIIFGVKGNLSSKKLIPSLYQLEKSNYLHKKTQIIGVGRANWNNKDYIQITFKTLKSFIKTDLDKKYWNIFKQRLSFCNLDVYEIKQFEKLKNILKYTMNTNIYYFSTPPNTFGNICMGLGKIKLNYKPNRIIVEKPIGTSLNSSKIINTQLGKYFYEQQIFRIDHYLGKETILNLLALRFANTLFYKNWDNTVIDHIKINVSETIGIEDRWSYFDQIGQTRDMVQNHLLQILSIVAMSPPKDLNFHSIRKEKIKVLKSLRTMNIHNVNQFTIRGQYSEGIINGQLVPSYINELGANKNSNTETFVKILVYIDNSRWQGVPFYLKTGKRLSNKISEITIYFKTMPIQLFNIDNQNKKLNKLIIRLQPNESITMTCFNKIPNLNPEYQLQNIELNFSYANSFRNSKIYDAYDRLLLESMRNNQSLFVCREEIEASWKWIDSIINAWSICGIKPQLYPSGTTGPKLSRKYENK
ncbi:glucose-6-phosphate dehydrogenase [Buchnera aphidicola]|uniref:Glucose-6-phosphate 1-dehydrogenase n=1 Tax=Buchnera aphidicola (Stegophylla sp.) TaxID=2315800 RepID=A0A4D6YL65_9GAMM|nr:glucose-6-phosphate dehydrogenase [Buchnera aphidicola (Stegophylla sp.)]QCI26378.1 glucose-6-phosphate dehydrogenase [Buchnera aphidicola (Stegophylla sp.)]